MYPYFENDLLVNYLKPYIDSEEPFRFWAIFNYLLAVGVSFVIGIIISFHVFGLVYLGKIGTGAIVAIALHNGLNGYDFDLGVLFEAIFFEGQDLLADWQALLITVTWFLISGGFRKEGVSAGGEAINV